MKAFKSALESIPSSQCVYIDKCGIKLNIIRDYGWSAKGEPILGCRTGKREKNLNIIAALNHKTLNAPFIYEGTMNTDWFNIYLRQYLLPTLKPGQIVIMDNASFHKSSETRKLIEQKGCQLWFLTPYSPDLNPIEHTWAILKRFVQPFRHHFDSVPLTLDFIFQHLKPFAL